MVYRSLTEIRAMLDGKKISAAELAGIFLERIKKYDEVLNSFITVTEEKALRQAKAAQETIDAGKSEDLTGIPCAIKDLICTKDTRTTCASRMLEDFTPPYNATVINKLDANHYVLPGKTNMDEFAMGGSTQTGAFGGAKNPFDINRVPGGSSGGSAVCVAAGLSPCSLGSDTGGSIRQPASFCGVTGLKPTYGTVSRYGLVAFASSLDQIGPIANSAEDCAVIMNAIAGRDEKDATSAKSGASDYTAKIGLDIKGMRIALPKEFFGDAIDESVKNAVMNAAKTLEKKGAVLVECNLNTLQYAVAAYYLISSAEAACNLSRYDGIKYGLRGNGDSYAERIADSRSRGFGQEVKRRILLGNYALSSGYYDAYYRKARALKQQVTAEYAGIFEKADIILVPTAPTTAYETGSAENDPIKMYTADICTVTVNLAALPAISVPCGYDRDGLPVGMSFIGKKFDEPTVIQVADCFEKTFEKKYPDLNKIAAMNRLRQP